jgi:multisubunit Na+/H+ antiporter MnhB subunit
MTFAKKKKNTDDIPGLTAAFTTPFVISSVAVFMVWLVLNGYIFPTMAWILGSIMAVALTVAQVPLYRALVGKSISRPGCLGGLYTYAACIVLCLLLLWQAGPDGALIGVIVTPLCCFGIAALVTSRESGQSRRKRRRR